MEKLSQDQKKNLLESVHSIEDELERGDEVEDARCDENFP